MWNFEFAKTLIESGADVNGRNKHGQTAMHIACKRGKFLNRGIFNRFF